ncbi:IS3 family transposase [Microbulbifer celer]|uniref:IS3 family transposase n=1 Tax=Microbulbifer celer TaxID=435905 RepID=A0ABW3UE73_9GAMM|nr:IS3 family transposase [Microbulbifer celer]UFN55884.1 IS3 family transposase [Microbulbifer celer]
MKYAYIDSLKDECSIVKMCRWLSVSRSGYYKWRNREPCQRTQRKLLVEKAVVTTFKQFKERYGAPRLVVELNAVGIPCSTNHVAQLLAKNGLKARNGKGYKYFPGPNATNHVSDNLLARDFTASKPNEKWVSDITYIKIEKGFVYLAVIMDLFSRKIIGWSLDTTMTNQLIMDAFEMAVASRKVKPGLILHSDRGVQYRSGEYQSLLLNEGIQPSMSRKGNCWDNAAMESFFGRMKVESIFAEELANKQEALSCVFEYIEMFYNTVRRHSANDQVSPNEFEGAYFENCA